MHVLMPTKLFIDMCRYRTILPTDAYKDRFDLTVHI